MYGRNNLKKYLEGNMFVVSTNNKRLRCFKSNSELHEDSLLFQLTLVRPQFWILHSNEIFYTTHMG